MDWIFYLSNLREKITGAYMMPVIGIPVLRTIAVSTCCFANTSWHRRVMLPVEEPQRD